MDFEELFNIIYYELNVYYLQPNIFKNLGNIKKVCKKWNTYFEFDKIIRLNINTNVIISNEKIFSLKNLNNIKYLNFNKNNYINDLNCCETLLYLYCSNTNIIEIPETLNCLEELDCSWCKNLIKIPEIKTLKILNCANTNISEIPETLNCLEELICYCCKNLIKIPKIKTLKILNCCRTNINEIPKTLNCLQELYCKSCKNLTKIPKINTLKTLNCRESNINKIPNILYCLEELNCNENIYIPDSSLLNLKYINYKLNNLFYC